MFVNSGGGLICGRCWCRSKCISKSLGRKWSFVNHTVEDEKINVGLARRWCCDKYVTCYRDRDSCDIHCT